MLKYCLYILLSAFVLLSTSCETVRVLPITQSTAPTTLLGSVGQAKNLFLERDYNTLAIPSYAKGIKLDAQVITFNKSSFKNFKKAQSAATAKVSVAYSDSLDVMPAYLQLRIADRIAVLNALNKSTNAGVKTYLRSNNKAQIVSNIAIVFNEKDMQAIVNADEVFIEDNGVKSYALKLYKANVLPQTIQFNQGVVFDYKSSSVCWQEDSKYQLQIVDVIGEEGRCSRGTYKSAKYAKKKINYSRF